MSKKYGEKTGTVARILGWGDGFQVTCRHLVQVAWLLSAVMSHVSHVATEAMIDAVRCFQLGVS